MKAKLIIDMPKYGCRDCPLRLNGPVYDRCSITRERIDDQIYKGIRHASCPLQELPDYRTMDIIKLHLSMRSYNSLKRAGINLVGELEQAIEDNRLIHLDGIGALSVKEIEDKLAEFQKEGI